MLEQSEIRAGATPSGDQVVAEIARYAHLLGKHVRELFVDDDLTVLGRLAADVACTYADGEPICPFLPRQAVADLLGVTPSAVAKPDRSIC